MKLWGKAPGMKWVSKILMKSSHRASNQVNEESIKWSQLFAYNSWRPLGLNSDAQERKRAEEHHPVKKDLLGVLTNFWKRII